jgi:hypothetical protein
MVPAGSTIKSDVFPQGNPPAGITVDLTQGLYSPVIDSKKFTGSAMYNIPATTSGYKVSVYCSAGEATVQWNGTGGIAYVGLYQTVSVGCRERVINSVVLTTTGTVLVTVTKE